MGSLSLYLKYRSQTFSDLIGQGHVTTTLQSALSSGRTSHAYLFVGPRGTGKTSTARLLAKTLCCEKGPAAEPCNECEICVSITAGSCVDVLEMDAASESGVDGVRETIVETAEYRPMVARYKVFIIDEVHDLSPKAFDALLKTIEEPPDHVVFILATTEMNKVPPTIRSRCQKFEFHRASMQDLVGRLDYVAKAEGVTAEPAALTAIARMADGGYRDALTLLEQLLVTGESVTIQRVYDQLGLVSDETIDALLVGIREGEVGTIMELLGEMARMGRDPKSVLESLLYRLSDLSRAAYGVEVGAASDAPREAAMHAVASRLGKEQLLRLRSDLAEVFKDIRDISLPRVWLEAQLLRMAVAVPEAPAPVKSAPATEPRPRASQAVAAVIPNVESRPAAPPEPSGDPNLDAARTVWAQAMAALPESTSIAIRLARAIVLSSSNGGMVVEVPRKTDVDWLMDNPKRHGHVAKLVRDASGKDWKIRYEAAKKEASDDNPPTVELPLEGERLVELAQQVAAGTAQSPSVGAKTDETA